MIIKDDITLAQSYLTDASNFHGYGDKVYIPESIEELQALLKEMSASGTPVTISGARTGLTGSSSPQGGVIVSMEKFNKILSIGTKAKTVTTQCGVYLNELQSEIEALGLLYPADPTERGCFIGGTIATNASGAKTFKYGATRSFVDELKTVLADGDVLHLKRGEVFAKGRELEVVTESGRHIHCNLPSYEMPNVKNASGYYVKDNMDAIDLFIGSEGTLGVIVEAKLKLLDKPENILSCVAFFNDEDSALEFVIAARDKSRSGEKLDARGLEFFDKRSLKFLMDDYPNIPDSAGAAIWFEQEYKNGEDDMAASIWGELVEQFNGDLENSWFAATPAEIEKFKEFRHAVSAKVNEFISRVNLRKVGTDVAVPDEHFKNFYYHLKSSAETSGINFLIYGHFGNSHYHLNLLPKNETEFASAKKLYGEICAKAVEMKGTVSAEHGIGKIKRDYLLMMYGEEAIKQMAQVKLAFDPKGILGRGNIFEEKYMG